MTQAADGAPAGTRWIGAAGAVASGVAVALGAFGAHVIRETVTADRLATFETAARYLFLHGLALLALRAQASAGALPAAAARRVAAVLLTGVVVFAGALGALVGTGLGFFGAVAPIGGALLLLGWGLWTHAAWPRRRS